MLMLQILKLMDLLWKEANLDLRSGLVTNYPTLVCPPTPRPNPSHTSTNIWSWFSQLRSLQR